MSRRSPSALSADAIRERIEPAAAAFRSAFTAYTSHSRPVFTTNISTRAAIAAGFSGVAARTTATTSTSSTVTASVQVNTRASAAASSSAAIGLDLTSRHSRLSSDPLGFDVDSPESPSTLASAQPLGLDLAVRATSLTSTSEMNGAPTSLGSSRLTFTSGTSAVEISGAYTGAASSLTFKITNAPNVLFKTMKFDVLDQNGTVVTSYSGQVSAGAEIDLVEIGLRVRFTDGSFSRGATATTTVLQAPADVDTSARFDAAWGAAPLFENFGRVTAGSFRVNGVQIAVAANDSIDSVLAKINAAGAGVTAAVAQDRIVLTSSSASESAITLSGDTSGFLQAAKLSSAASVVGNLRDDQQALAGTAAFGSIADGSFTLNGVAISVDRNADTLATLVDRINGSAAGVVAWYDAAADKLVLQSADNSEDAIEFGADTSGFVAAAGLSSSATVRGNVRDDLQVLSKTSAFTAVRDGAFTINGVSISVDADLDSLVSLIDRINGAGAGVTAAFNASTGAIDLASTADSEDAIVVGGDSSGFLAAAGLRTGATVLGSVADDGQRLADTAAFATVSAGNFLVNGVSIAVDPDGDSVQDVLDRINSSGAGVTAVYEAGSDRITLTPDAEGASLSLAADTTGFLDAARLSAGTTGTRLDPDAAFDGSDGRDPLFDDGVQVGGGGFTINGVSISVAAHDSVATVLARISESAAGVTAAYDASRDVVTLTGAAGGGSIALGADTSGFLTAVKLDATAIHASGAASVDPYDGAIGHIAEYSAVTAGVLTINGTQIGIDPSSTTLRGVLHAIEASGAAVTFDQESGRLRVAAADTESPLSVSDTSGLMSALGIATGVYRSSPASTTVAETQTGTEIVSNAADVVRAVQTASAKLSAALSELAADRPGDAAFLDAIVSAASDAAATLRDGGLAGITIGGVDADIRIVVDRDALTEALESSGAAAVSALASRVLDELASRVAAAAIEPGPVTKTVPTSAMSLAPDSAAAVSPGLLFLKALGRAVHGQAPGPADGEDRPADGALDHATRTRVRAGLQRPQADPADALTGLLESVVMNRR